jgi:hypothetical protein
MSESFLVLKTAVAAANETLQSLLDLDSQVAKVADLIEQCLRAGNKLLVCGNGGSAADASHFATEFVVRFMKDRPAYPAICLAGDGGLAIPRRGSRKRISFCCTCCARSRKRACQETSCRAAVCRLRFEKVAAETAATAKLLGSF